MRLLLLITISCLGISEMAKTQISFYVAPVVTVKGHYRSNSNKQFYDKTSYENEYFEYQSRRLLFSSFGLGIKGGINLKNKWLFEFGWSQDETSSGNRTYTTSFTDHTPFGGIKSYTPSNGGSIYTGVQTNRFYLSSHYKLINPEKYEQKKFWVVPYIHFGMGLNLNTFKTPVYQHMYFEDYYNLIDENVAMKVDNYLNVGVRTNIHGQIGFSTDFMIKKHYLFSFSVYSTFSGKTKTKNRDLSSVTTTIYIDNGTDVKRYNFNDGSRGTGLYFEISRRFQLYPWRPYKKLKNNEL